MSFDFSLRKIGQRLTNLYIFATDDACSQFRPQLLHVTMCPSLPLFFICSYLFNIPVVVSVHTDSVTLLGKCNQPWWVVRLVKMMEPLGTWFADATYTVSPSYAGILVQRVNSSRVLSQLRDMVRRTLPRIYICPECP